MIYFSDFGVAPVTYTTLDSRDKTSNFALTNGDLTATRSGGAATGYVLGRDGKSSGKWMFEVTINAIGSGCNIGVVGAGWVPNPYLGGHGQSNGYSDNSFIYANNAVQYNGSTYTTGDVIGVYYNADTGHVWFAKNGVWVLGDAETGDVAGEIGINAPSNKAVYPAFESSGGSVQATVNFGATAFAYPSLAPSFSGWTTTTPPANATTFRSCRLAMRSPGYFAHGFAEWELMASSGGATLFSGGTPSASHAAVGAGTNNIANGFDGNTSTAVLIAPSSGVQAQGSGWYAYDIGSNATRNATHTAIRARAGTGGEQDQAPTAFDLYFSDDNLIFHKGNVGLSVSAFVGATPGQRKEVAL